MHVLQFIDSLAPAGAERSLAALVPPLVAAGVRLDVAAFSTLPGLRDEIVAGGGEVVLLGGDSRADRFRRALALVRAERPDLVHTMLFEADLAGRLAGVAARVPVVSTIASVAYGPEHRSSPGLQAWRVAAAQLADAATARGVRRFHAVSEHVRQVMGRRLAVPSGRIDVVRRGRDPVTLGRRTPGRRATMRSALAVADNSTLVLAVARHEHQKGLDVLVSATPAIRAALGEVRVVVAGREGAETARLRAMAARLGLADDALVLLGHRDDVADLLCAADVFVLPSRWEGLPGALVEAMALEAPLVASDIPPVREVVDDDQALLVPPGRATALADAVVAAATDPASAGRRVQQARWRFTSSFTIDAAARGMVAFYERALAGRRR